MPPANPCPPATKTSLRISKLTLASLTALLSPLLLLGCTSSTPASDVARVRNHALIGTQVQVSASGFPTVRDTRVVSVPTDN